MNKSKSTFSNSTCVIQKLLCVLHREKVEKKPSKLAKWVFFHSICYLFDFHLLNHRLVGYRWVVPAYGQRKIKLLFSSKECGQFDHTFNFEVAGTRQRYQLFCRGQCHVPSICQDPQYVMYIFLCIQIKHPIIKYQ